MSLHQAVESIIKEAQERGAFDNLPGKGKPIDLTTYFETPEDVRVAQSVLKNAGFTSREVELLNEVAGLKQVLAGVRDETIRQRLQKQVQEKQIEFNVLMERQKRLRK